MALAPSYNVLSDHSGKSSTHISTSPYWVIAVIRLGQPLSFSRATMSSVTTDVTEGALLRNEKPLLISDDCIQLAIQGGKRSHLKQLNATLLPGINYLAEILCGDYIMAWLVNNQNDHETLLGKISQGRQANAFNDGLKFVGRVTDVRTSLNVDRNSGMKTAFYTLSATAFQELDTQLFYDHSLMSADVREQSLGLWLARLGLSATDLFRQSAESGAPENVNTIIPTLIDLIIGKGPRTDRRSDAAITLEGRGGDVSSTPSLDNEAPYSYLVPAMVGKLLGVEREQASKPSKIISYADILDLVQGIQNYTNYTNDHLTFVPDFAEFLGGRFVTPTPMSGSFMPQMPEFINRPLWSVLQQYLNPTVNEMYTALRVGIHGNVMPTIVVRQIPFTTEAFPRTDVPATRFLTLPRWVIPDVMISSVEVGSSDQSRVNFVHIYGQAAYLGANNVPIQTQIINNPPIQDALDVMRSGMRPFMTSVECWLDDQIDTSTRKWMELVADWTIGSQHTLNGTLTCLGVQSPVCEGDNLEFDGVVYHIESVSHQAGIDIQGNKTWTTTFQLTNGMRAQGSSDSAASEFPIYPRFRSDDNTKYQPGISHRGRQTTGGRSDHTQSPDQQKPKAQPTSFDSEAE